MVADEQTHMLPEDDEGLERIARMLRLCRCRRLFRGVPRRRCRRSSATMRALFETAPQLSAGIGNLVFTGDVDDPDTLRTLAAALGFKRPSDICRVIRGWHFGRYRATQLGRGARAADRTDAGAAAAPSARRAAPTRR